MNAIKLEYVGRQEYPSFNGYIAGSVRLWNIMSPEHPAYRSTVSLAGLRSYGIIKRTTLELH